MMPDRKWHLVPHTMRNVRGKETPLVAASKLLGGETEGADLLLLPIASPLLQPGFDVPVEVAVGIAVQALATPLLRGRLDIIWRVRGNRMLRAPLLDRLVFVLRSLSDGLGGLLLLANAMSFAHLRIHPSICCAASLSQTRERNHPHEWEC